MNTELNRQKHSSEDISNNLNPQDEADLRAYEEAKAEYDANPITYSHDEVVQMLDI